MALTTAQKKERKRYIGSSEVAQLLGLSPWGNIYDLWLEKTDRLMPEPPKAGAAQDGLLFESGVLKWAEKELGALIKDPGRLWFKHPKSRLISHPDALVKATGEPVEAKTSGLRSPLPPGWGENGSDEIPDYYIVQAQVHLMLTESEVCHVPAYLAGGRGFNMFHVNHNSDLQETILKAVDNFWTKFVKTDTPPPDKIPHLETVKRVIREPGLLIDVEPTLLETYALEKEGLKARQQSFDFAKAALIAALGDAEGSADGRVTYKMQFRKGYTVPDCEFRVLRIKKEKPNG